MSIYNNKSGRNSSVGITTRYELDGPRIESQWRQDFRCPSRQTPRPNQPPVDGYRIYPGSKVAPPSADVVNVLEL